MERRGRQTDAVAVRSLRRAAARSAGGVEVAAVRTGGARPGYLRARLVGRQGSDLYSDEGGGRAAEESREAAGECEVPDRGRGRDRRGAYRKLCAAEAG